MDFQKRILAEIEKCYAVSGLTISGKPYLIYAGEGKGSIHIFHDDEFSAHLTLAEGCGGTMSIVPLPEKEGWFFVSRGFYSMVDSEKSVIELVRYRNCAFEPPCEIAAIPYLHRFGLVHGSDGTTYILAASLHSFKADKEDWSHPGHVFYAPLPGDLEGDFSLTFTQLPGEYYMNHGFCTALFAGQEAAFTTSREGAFAWFAPEEAGGPWCRTQLLDFPISDIAVQDIDGDGQEELAILLPFHGDQCKVLHRAETGYREIYSSPEKNDFYHAITGAVLNGQKVFVGGARKGVMDLFILAFDQASDSVTLRQVDTGVGPSNVAVLNLPGEDLILSANRMIAQAAVYSSGPV
ncbi:MAG: hypothetical protein ACI3VB_01685 [Oscillospiraceae bacterium]